MAFNPQDHFFKMAKKDGYACRSAYKLEEIQKRCSILKSGDRVLDLGCFPGAWSQISLEVIGKNGFVEGIDLKEVSISAPNARFRVQDAFELEPSHFDGNIFDVILSDMAPSTTGHMGTDQARSEALCEHVLAIVPDLLKPKGNMAMKIFMGPGIKAIESQMRSMFAQVKHVKPKSTRKESKEIFLVGQSFSGQA